MSGHSKWSTIKHKKAAADAKRGKIFSKIAKELMIAARSGGGDPSGNITLRAIIQKARGVNMPADNIDRAIKKGTGELAADALEEVMYEGYAQGGVAVIVEVVTDNRNRSASEVRHVFTRFSGSLAGQGSVLRNFSRKGVIVVDASAIGEDQLMELVIEAGAEDMTREDGTFEIVTGSSEYAAVLDAIGKAGLETVRSELTLLPDAVIPVTDASQAKSLIQFVEALEDLDDVQNVYANFDIDDELLSAISDK